MADDEIDLVPLVRQRLAWDILPCDHDYWELLGIVRPSPEVEDAAHAESHVRMALVKPIQAFLEVYSVLAADIITEVMYDTLREAMPPAEEEEEKYSRWHDATLDQNREIVRGAVFPVVANLMEAGILARGTSPETTIVI